MRTCAGQFELLRGEGGSGGRLCRRCSCVAVQLKIRPRPRADDSMYLLTASADQFAKLWSTQTGKVLCNYDIGG